MKKSEIACLEANLGIIFDRRSDLSLDEEWLVVGEDQLMPKDDAIEDWLYGGDESAAIGGGPDYLGSLEGALSRIDEPGIPSPPVRLARAGQPGAIS